MVLVCDKSAGIGIDAMGPSMQSRLLTRTMNGAALTGVANHPFVRPWLGGSGFVDLTAACADPANVALETDGGGFLLLGKGGGLYEAHTLFVPEAGRKAPAASREGFLYLFTHTDAVEVVTMVPSNNAPAGKLAHYVGFTPRFTRQAAWPTEDGVIPAEYFSLTVEQWALKSDDCLAAGVAFHGALERAKEAAGSALDIHADDEIHDRIVGATCLMARAGNAAKGVAFYNRWAVTAGYAPISLICENPPILDVIDAVVTPGGDFLEVLLCR